PFYHVAFPTNHWMLSGGVDFTFPAGQQLAPGSVIIVCSTNPTDFRAQYGVSPSIPVYGPWTNVLDNAGESIKLLRPGDPEPTGFVPYYRVDHLRYEPVAPWPVAADSGGVSLSRINLQGYANDPANWQPSSFGGNPGVIPANHAPTLAANGTNSVTEGELIALDLDPGDLDSPWQTLTLTAQNVPPGGTLDPTNGTFTWTTTEADGPG